MRVAKSSTMPLQCLKRMVAASRGLVCHGRVVAAVLEA